MIQILDLKDQYSVIKDEIFAAIKKVVDSQNFVLGEDLKALEEEMAVYCTTKHGIGVGSGTDALTISLMALGIKSGDEVITSPFTFFSSAEAISLVGATPVFVDIDPKAYTIDPALIEKRISKRTKAIIPVHLYGQCADMDPIISLAKKHGIRIVEDCAQAIGAIYKGRKAGSMGDLGALSFYPSKNLGGYGEGGMIVTQNSSLAERVRMLRVHGSSVRYVHSMIGTNSRLDNIQAAILRVKLRYINAWLDARREKARYYSDRLKDLPLDIPYIPSYNVPTYHLYVIRPHTDLAKFMEFLTKNDIETRTYYPIPLHLQECYAALGYKKGDLKNSEDAASQTCAIPLYPEISKKDMDHVIDTIRRYFKAT